MLKKIKTVTFAVITVITSLFVTDLAIHAAAVFFPRINDLVSVAPKYVPDPKLGHRPNPAHPEHDANGFRNPRVPASAEVTVLGDSQTYGTGVRAEQAWPRVLESSSGRSVYSLAFGGWGPSQSLLLWDEAIALQPEIVVATVYAGNDLYDTYQSVYPRNLLPELRSDNPEMLEKITSADTSGSLNKRVSKAYRSGKKRSSRFRRWRKSIKQWFIDHSMIYGLFWRTGYELSQIREKRRDEEEKWRKAKSRAEKRPEFAQAFTNGGLRTVFTSQLRLAVLDLDDPLVREGQRLAYEVITRLQTAANAADIRFVVLLIPTKEFVFAQQAKSLAAPDYHALIRNEQQFWRETGAFLESRGIEYVDALPALRSRLDSGPQPYEVSDDGHPNVHGHQAIAEAVQAYLDEFR